MAQNLAPASTGMDPGCCRIGSMFDNEMNEILGLDGIRESVVYMSVVGQTGVCVQRLCRKNHV